MAFLLSLGVLPAFAQDSVESRACNDKATVQMEMNKCASDEARRTDDELNKLYAKLIATLSGNPEATAKVKAAERAWIAYRDAYMDATYPAKDKQMEYGSMFPMEFDLLLAQLTREHIKAIADLLQKYDPSK